MTYDYTFAFIGDAKKFTRTVRDAIANTVGNEFTSADADAIYHNMDPKITASDDFIVTVEFTSNGTIEVKGPIVNSEDDEATSKESEESKIDWKLIIKIAGFGALCFLLGKRNRRYKEISKKGIHFDVPGSDVWTPEQHSAVSTFIYSMNECMNKNRIVYHIDRKNRR